MEGFVECFVTLFVVGNALPLVPLYLGLTDHMSASARQRLALASVATGGAVATTLALVGSHLLKILTVTVHDIRIAGGIILLVFATHDILFSRERRKRIRMEQLSTEGASEPAPVAGEEEHEVGVVPIGVPLIVGPGTIATVLALAEVKGLSPTLSALSLNVLINLVLLLGAVGLQRLLGQATMRVVGKVMSLLLAAIAVAMLRVGFAGAIGA